MGQTNHVNPYNHQPNPPGAFTTAVAMGAHACIPFKLSPVAIQRMVESAQDRRQLTAHLDHASSSLSRGVAADLRVDSASRKLHALENQSNRQNCLTTCHFACPVEYLETHLSTNKWQPLTRSHPHQPQHSTSLDTQ